MRLLSLSMLRITTSTESPFFTTSDAFSYTVAGHTDSRGSEAYNQTLSEARASAVASVARSVGAVVESEAGFGESQPVATNDTAEGMAQEVDSIGGQLDAFTSKEYAGYYMKVLDEHLPIAVDLLADLDHGLTRAFA